MSTRAPHRLSVLGDFYVENDCCTACGVPEMLAPDMFAYDQSSHCYVRKQPSSEAELDRMLEVVGTQELGCIRYRGSDRAVVDRLREIGEVSQWDGPDRSNK